MAGLLALSALALAAMPASPALAAIYFGYGSTVRAVNLDGSPNLPALRRSDGSPLMMEGDPTTMIHGRVCGVAVDARHLYWSENGVIARFELDGGTSIQRLVGGAPGTCGVAVDGSYLYWPSGGGSLGRANLDGSGANLSFVTGGYGLCGVAVSPSHVYWADRTGGRIGRAKLDGTGVEHGFVDEPIHPCGVAVDDRYVYWGEGGSSVGRAALDGTGVDREFVTGTGEAWGVAVHGGHLYWTDRGFAHGTVGRANLDGSGANRAFVVADGPGAFGVAVDSRVVSPPPKPSAHVRFGRVSHNKRKGIVRIVVRVPAHGALRMRSAGLRGRFLNDRRSSRPNGPFRLSLKLWPRGKGKVARRIREQLKRRGRAEAMFRVVHREDGALPVWVSKRVVLLRGGRPGG